MESGKIPAASLYTIRKDEIAFDNVKGVRLPVAGEIIKLKGKEGRWTCVFLDEENLTCTIYENRPMECRVLKCWDTSEIENIYDRDRLTRRNLIAGIQGLWELIEDHQQKCAYAEIKVMAQRLKSGQKAVQRKICEMIAYDDQIRKLVIEKNLLDSGQLDFLFGRPLVKTITMFGFSCTRQGDQWILSL